MAEVISAARRPVTPPPLHVALPGKLAEQVRELAEARGDQASVFVVAAMARIVSDDLTAAVFDGDRAAQIAPGQARQSFEVLPSGLTLLQAGVVYVLGFHADADGICRLPAVHFAKLIGRGSDKYVAAVLHVLAEKQVARAVTEKNGVRNWTLTELGKSIFRELSGDKDA